MPGYPTSAAGAPAAIAAAGLSPGMGAPVIEAADRMASAIGIDPILATESGVDADSLPIAAAAAMGQFTPPTSLLVLAF